MIDSFYDLFLKMDSDYSDRIALRWVDEDGEIVCSRTFGEYCADIRHFVKFLKDRLGNPVGKHIAILSENRYEFFVAIYACFLTECVFVPLNYQKELDELLDEIERADVLAIIYAPETLDQFPQLSEQYIGPILDIFEYRRYPEDEIREACNLSTLAAILYTSGTTGHSKGVMLSQKNLLVSFQQIAYVDNKLIFEQFSGEDHPFFQVLPLFHIGGLDALANFLLGESVNICKSPRYFYRDIALMPSFCTFLVPMFFTLLHKDIINGHRDRLGILRQLMTVGANADKEAISCLLENGYFIQQGYGLTESASSGTRNNSQHIKYIDSIGTRQEVIQIKLDDGEVCLKGDTVFMGYYNEPEETSKVIDADGWFHTGDLATVDEDGNYYLTGRKKNLIILSSGENISPEELENRLLANEDISETIVREQNDRIIAEIFCKESKRPAIGNFVRELNCTLPMYKHISNVEFRDTPFERTATGKIKR